MEDTQRLSPRTISLIVRGRGADRRAIEELIGCYQDRIARFVLAQTSADSHYEDLCQTIFVKMVLALPRLREAERFEPWLFQIARNVCRDHLRSRSGWRRLFTAYEPATHDAISASHESPAEDGARAVEHGLEHLPAAQRDLLKLSLEGEKSYEDMARLSNVSVSAIKSRLHRAREGLREILLAGERE